MEILGVFESFIAILQNELESTRVNDGCRKHTTTIKGAQQNRPTERKVLPERKRAHDRSTRVPKSQRECASRGVDESNHNSKMMHKSK